MVVIIIAALDDGGVIGNKGAIPWNLLEDFKHFKRTTKGHAIIMGRATFESIGKPLPDRLNIVLSRNPTPGVASNSVRVASDGIIIKQSLPDAIAEAQDRGHSTIFLIGGAGVYQEGMDIADKMVLSHVDGTHEGDTFFPAWDRKEWSVVEEQKKEGFAIKVYERKPRGT